MDRLLEFLDAPEQTFRFEYDQAKGIGSHVANDPDRRSKVGYVFLMVIISILLHAEFGRNDQREDASYFSKWSPM